MVDTRCLLCERFNLAEPKAAAPAWRFQRYGCDSMNVALNARHMRVKAHFAELDDAVHATPGRLDRGTRHAIRLRL